MLGLQTTYSAAFLNRGVSGRVCAQSQSFQQTGSGPSSDRVKQATPKSVQPFVNGKKEGGLPLRISKVNSILSSESNWKEAVRLFQWMKCQPELQPTLFSYNLVVRTLVRSGQWSEAERLVLEMPMRGLMPDNITYNTLISGASRRGSHAKALEWCARMSSSGCVPDNLTYASMISVYANAGRTQEAEKVYQELCAKGHPVSKDIYGAMIPLYSRTGRLQEAAGLYRDMHARWMRGDEALRSLSALNYNTMMAAFEKANLPQQVLRVFAELQEAGIAPDRFTWSTVLKVLPGEGRAQEGVQLLRRLQPGKDCDQAVFTGFLSALAAEKLVAETDEVLQIMEAGLGLTDGAAAVALSLYAELQDLPRAQLLMTSLHIRGASAASFPLSWTSLLKVHARLGSEGGMRRTTEELLAHTGELDAWAHATLLAAVPFLMAKGAGVDGVLECLAADSGPRARALHALLQRGWEGEEGASLAAELLACTPKASQRPLVNAACDAVYSQGKRREIVAMVKAGRRHGLFLGLDDRSETREWKLDLRTASRGAASVLIEEWLEEVASQWRQGPEDLRLAIGFWRGSEESFGRKEGLEDVIMDVCKRRGIARCPFEAEESRRGWWSCSASKALGSLPHLR